MSNEPVVESFRHPYMLPQIRQIHAKKFPLIFHNLLAFLAIVEKDFVSLGQATTAASKEQPVQGSPF